MKIKVNIEWKTAEIEGYGTIRVRGEGANEGLKAAENARIISELSDELSSLSKDEAETEKNKEQVREIMQKVREIQADMITAVRSQLDADDPTVIDRLLNEVPLGELRRIMTEILANA